MGDCGMRGTHDSPHLAHLSENLGYAPRLTLHPLIAPFQRGIRCELICYKADIRLCNMSHGHCKENSFVLPAGTGNKRTEIVNL